MTTRVLVFQHASFCPPEMIGDGLARDGIETTIVHLDQGHAIPDLDHFNVLVALGGPMDVWQESENPWLIAEKLAIRKWVLEADKPFLGICLGHQLLAEALGGEVRPAETPEAGILKVDVSTDGRRHPLYAGFGEETRAIQWHGAEVTRAPAGARILASTPACPITAFAAGSSAFGIQYHVEAGHALAEEWAETPAGFEILERVNGKGAKSRVLAEVRSAMPELSANARLFYDNFMRIARQRLTE